MFRCIAGRHDLRCVTPGLGFEAKRELTGMIARMRWLRLADPAVYVLCARRGRLADAGDLLSGLRKAAG